MNFYETIYYIYFVEQKKNSVKLSHQQEKVRDAAVPMPIYTAINSKRDVSAQSLAGETTHIDFRRILRARSNVNFLCFRMGGIHSL